MKMIVTYILALLVSTNPYPMFAFINEFKTFENCTDARELVKENRENYGCLALAREGI